MDDGLSSFTRENINFGVEPGLNDDAEEDAADLLKRNKLIEEDLDNVLNGLSEDEANDSDSSDDDSDSNSNDSDDSKSSDAESSLSHHSQSEVSKSQHSLVKESYEHSVQPNEPNQHSALIRCEFPPIKHHSDLTNSEVIYSTASDVNYSKISDLNNSRNSDDSRNSEEINDTNISNVNHSYSSDVNQSNVNHLIASDIHQSNDSFTHRTSENQLNYENISNPKSDVISNSRKIYSLPRCDANEPVTKTYDQHDYGDVSSGIPPVQFNYQPGLYDEFKKLQLLYSTRGQELEQVKREEIRAREAFEREIKSLTGRLTIIEGEKNNLTSALQEAHNNCSEFTHENNVLKGRLTALELQFSAEKKAKEAVQSKLESAEVVIQSLEQQIKDSTQSDNALRLQQQNENVVKDLKLRYQKDLLKYKEEIDRLQENLNAKVIEAETLSSKLHQLQKQYEELQIEKCETFNKLSASLDASQREYQKLLESGALSEVAKLRLQLQHVQEENSKLEKQNSALKDEVKSLEAELRTSETVKSLTQENELHSERHKKGQSSHSESDLKGELQKSLKVIQSLRVQNHSLKEHLEQVTHKLPFEEEKAKLFESRYKESESKLKELEKKLEEVLPFGSIPKFQHEKKVKSLESELAECKRKLQNLAETLKISSLTEANLHEENKSLKNTINEMLQKHTQEKLKITEDCRKKCLEIQENAFENLKQELTSKADSELQTTCWNYENKINKLQREIKQLNDGLYDAKAQYVRIFEENKSLQSKIDSMSQSKERAEIEREIRLAYEKKLNKMEEQIQKDKSQFQSNLKSEIEVYQIEWTKKKVAQIDEFVNQTKQQLDEEFVKCIEKEILKLEAEKKKILDECQDKINSLQDKYEAEKKNLNANIQLKWESEMQKIQQNHQAEIKLITDRFEKKIAAMENEVKILKERNSYDFEQKAEMERLNTDLAQQCEEEKNNYTAKLRESFQKKWKSEVGELLLSHQSEIESLKKKFKDKITALENEIKTLKENHLRDFKSEEVQNLKEEYSKERLAWENEKLDLIKSEHVLKNKLSTAVEIEKKLLEKIKKFKKYIKSLESTNKEKTDTLLKQNEELKKSNFDKENELQLVKHEYDRFKHSLDEKHKKCPYTKHSQCQTEDEIVSRRTLLNVYEMFIQCLKTISGEVKVFLLESRKRSAEQLRKALSFYHDHLVSKIFHDVLRDARTISPNIGIPRVNRNLKSAGSSSDNLSSPNSAQHRLNSNYKISNSTPFNAVITSDTHKNFGVQMNDISNVKTFQNARLTPDIPNGFADMSFDFVPIKMRDLEQTSVKLPQYSVAGGLFHDQNMFYSYPEKHSPMSHIK